MFVYVLVLEIPYENSILLGVFSDYEKALEASYSYKSEVILDSDYVIRKVEIDRIYETFGTIGEEM